MDLPTAVRNKATRLDADAWVRDLPELVAELERRWGIAVGRTYPDATEAYVAEATTSTGTAAVLKILVPRSDLAIDDEIVVLRLAGGEGCVKLLAADEAVHAMLLERLGPSMYDLRLPMARRHQIMCDLARRVWRPAPDAGLPTGAEKARWIAAAIATTWEELDRPCREQAVALAIACAERRGAAHDEERARLVHGDVHQWNTLRARDGWKLVDPDGLLAEPEYDLGVIMREDPAELMTDADPWDRARFLAARTGTDATAIWEWGAAERVSTG